MLEFYKTQAGRTFFDHHVPKLIENLERIASSLEQKGAIGLTQWLTEQMEVPPASKCKVPSEIEKVILYKYLEREQYDEDQKTFALEVWQKDKDQGHGKPHRPALRKLLLTLGIEDEDHVEDEWNKFAMFRAGFIAATEPRKDV